MKNKTEKDNEKKQKVIDSEKTDTASKKLDDKILEQFLKPLIQQVEKLTNDISELRKRIDSLDQRIALIQNRTPEIKLEKNIAEIDSILKKYAPSDSWNVLVDLFSENEYLRLLLYRSIMRFLKYMKELEADQKVGTWRILVSSHRDDFQESMQDRIIIWVLGDFKFKNKDEMNEFESKKINAELDRVAREFYDEYSSDHKKIEVARNRIIAILSQTPSHNGN